MGWDRLMRAFLQTFHTEVQHQKSPKLLFACRAIPRSQALVEVEVDRAVGGLERGVCVGDLNRRLVEEFQIEMADLETFIGQDDFFVVLVKEEVFSALD